jgi:hypothetical protein
MTNKTTNKTTNETAIMLQKSCIGLSMVLAEVISDKPVSTWSDAGDLGTLRELIVEATAKCIGLPARDIRGELLIRADKYCPPRAPREYHRVAAGNNLEILY